MTTHDSALEKIGETFLRHIIDDGYSPEERRARYLRERQLKGRKPAAAKPIGSGRSTRSQAVSTKRGPAKKTGANLSKVAASRQALKARAASIEGRIGVLQKVLKDLLAEKAGKQKSESEKKAASKESSEKRTAQQKSKQAAASKDYYEKNKEKILKKAKDEAKATEDKALDAKIQSVRSQIRKMQSELASARRKIKRS